MKKPKYIEDQLGVGASMSSVGLLLAIVVTASACTMITILFLKAWSLDASQTGYAIYYAFIAVYGLTDLLLAGLLAAFVGSIIWKFLPEKKSLPQEQHHAT